MANDGIQSLIEEHIVITKVLNALRKAVAGQKQGNEVPAEFFANAGEFASEFADKCHHAKEEKLFFPLVETQLPEHHADVERFLEEHVQGRAMVGQLRESAGKGNLPGCAGFAEAYFTLLTQHIARENALFHECRQKFSEAQKEELFEASEKVERDEIGEGMDEKYRAMAEDLAKKANEF